MTSREKTYKCGRNTVNPRWNWLSNYEGSRNPSLTGQTPRGAWGRKAPTNECRCSGSWRGGGWFSPVSLQVLCSNMRPRRGSWCQQVINTRQSVAFIRFPSQQPPTSIQLEFFSSSFSIVTSNNKPLSHSFLHSQTCSCQKGFSGAMPRRISLDS